MLNFTKDGRKQALDLLKIIERIYINEPLKALGTGSGSGEIDLLILQIIAEYLAELADCTRLRKGPLFKT